MDNDRAPQANASLVLAEEGRVRLSRAVAGLTP
jgi:hypothetical protein